MVAYYISIQAMRKLLVLLFLLAPICTLAQEEVAGRSARIFRGCIERCDQWQRKDLIQNKPNEPIPKLIVIQNLMIPIIIVKIDNPW